jgi:hypothetical protein
MASIPDPLTLAARMAARVASAYRAELHRLNPPEPAGPGEHSCTSATTSASWQPAIRQPARATALDGIGFTAAVTEDE